MNKALKQFELSNSNEFDLIKISIASPSVETSRIEVASKVEKKVIPSSNGSISFFESIAAINIVILIKRIDKIIQDLLLPMFDSEK